MPSTDPSACGNRFEKNSGSSSSFLLAHVSIEIGVDVLDKDLAAELLAEEVHVAADDRSEIEQDRGFLRRQRRQEFSSALVEKTGSSTRERRRVRRLGVGTAWREAI